MGNLFDKYVARDGRVRFKGKKKEMKGSQAYTRRFGRVVANLYMRNRRAYQSNTYTRNVEEVQAMLQMDPASDDPWADAELDEVFSFLMNGEV